jgi:CMP-N-acetylneuraminic acid synthetase
MRTLGIIPARGGSKEVHRKNARPLCGKPLIGYTAEVALASARLNRVVVSTDDEGIASLARRFSLDVPFMRPAELARDDTPMLPVVQHALTTLRDEGDSFDAVCLLQPTTPIRGGNEIDGCIRMLVESEADAVVTVTPVPPEYNPHWVYIEEPGGGLRLASGEWEPVSRRQDLPEAFHRDGSVYVTRTEVVLGQNSLYGKKLLGYIVRDSKRVNIDTEDDWRRAERLLGCGDA